MDKKNADALESRVVQFVQLVAEGVDAWTKAGALLSEMAADDPGVYAKIIARHPYLTMDILRSIERVGRREIAPLLLVDQSPGAQMLRSLPYDEQVRLYSEPVPVVVNRQRELSVQHKRPSELTRVEAQRVFDGNRMRTVSEQRELAKADFRRGTPSCASRHPKAEPTPEPAAGLEEDPNAMLGRLLTNAHDALLEARTALAMIKRDSKFDDFIANALNSVGQLRFQLNSGGITR